MTTQPPDRDAAITAKARELAEAAMDYVVVPRMDNGVPLHMPISFGVRVDDYAPIIEAAFRAVEQETREACEPYMHHTPGCGVFHKTRTKLVKQPELLKDGTMGFASWYDDEPAPLPCDCGLSALRDQPVKETL